MQRVCIVLMALLCVVSAAEDLDHSKVGVYGTLFDFCDFSVYKFIYKDAAQFADALPRYRKMLSDATAKAKPNLVLLYTFDRIKHSRPLEEYVRDTDTVLQALDLKQIHAVCLSEENVTWNNGLHILNSLYDHVKARYGVQVYQWLTMPDIPHPKLRADGWIIDPYGFDRARFRRYLQKYLVTGKPVIDCITASPDPGAPFNETPPQQVEVCREFNVPMFFYCVDNKWRSPSAWLQSDDPSIVRPREWLMGVVAEVHREGARGLPLASANMSTGRPVEAAGDENGVYEYVDAFGGEDFLDDATFRGFLGLTWDGQNETLSCDVGRSGLEQIELRYYFTSPFKMAGVKAELKGSQDGGLVTGIGVSDSGGRGIGGMEAKTAGPFALAVAEPAFSGHEFHVRLTVTGRPGRSTLEELRVTCGTIAPERREVRLEPDATRPRTEGAERVAYVEDFASRKYLHLAEVQGAEFLLWKRGEISTHGVKGRANRVEAKWKCVSDKPLSNVRVVVEGAANGRNLGATNTAGLSLDGGNVLVSDTTEGKSVNPRAQGWCKEALVLDGAARPEFANVRAFYLHLTMVNTSGAHTNTSNRFTRFEVSAETR